MPRGKKGLLLALALLAAASAPTPARAECTPKGVMGSKVIVDTSDSDASSNCDNSDGEWEPDDWTSDSGYGREMTTGIDTTRAEASVYVWAEDGDAIFVSFEAGVNRSWTFSTICHPAASHAVPPVGGAIHRIRSDLVMSYNAGASGGDAQRSGAATLSAIMPTGRAVTVDWHSEDSAAASNSRYARWTLEGGGSFSESTEVSGSLSGFVAGKIGAMADTGTLGTVLVTHTSDWSGNSAESASDLIILIDTAEIRTDCHGAVWMTSEYSGLTGSLDIGPTPGSSDVAFVHGDFNVHQITVVIAVGDTVCGDEVVVPPAPDPGPGGGGETTPPDDPDAPPGGTATEDPEPAPDGEPDPGDDPADDGEEPTEEDGTDAPDAVGGEPTEEDGTDAPDAVGGEGGTGGSGSATADGGDATAPAPPTDPEEETGGMPEPDPNEPAPDDPPDLPDGMGLAQAAGDRGWWRARWTGRA